MTGNMPAASPQVSDAAIKVYDPNEALESLIAQGDLSKLSPGQRVSYYRKVCDTLHLNPFTRPFEYLELDGKLTLYARRDATDQIRANNRISVTIVSREFVEGLYIVTARATDPSGRHDESTGAVALEKEDGEWKTSQSGKRYFAGNGEYKPLRGTDRANAIMRCESKAKRRVTLSLVGLGWMEESELDGVPQGRVVSHLGDEATTPPAPHTAAPAPPANTTTVHSPIATNATAPPETPPADNPLTEAQQAVVTSHQAAYARCMTMVDLRDAWTLTYRAFLAKQIPLRVYEACEGKKGERKLQIEILDAWRNRINDATDLVSLATVSTDLAAARSSLPGSDYEYLQVHGKARFAQLTPKPQEATNAPD